MSLTGNLYGVCSKAIAVLICLDKESAKAKDEALDLPIDLHSYSRLWSGG